MFTRFIAFLLMCQCFLFASVEVIQKKDAQGRLLSEKWDNGAYVNYTYSENETAIEISGFGKIKYLYDGLNLKKIERWNGGKLSYCHEYKADKEALINGLGDRLYQKIENGLEVTTPYSKEICYYDESKNLLQHQFDDHVVTHKYDSQFRLVDDEAFDEEDTPFNSNTNDLGQLLERGDISCEYDLNGNMTQKASSDLVYQYTYDDSNQLTYVVVGDKEVELEYDSSNRRIGKKVYHNNELVRDQVFVHLGSNEIGSYDRISKRKELRIPGDSYHENIVLPIAIEINDKIYAPILDAQGNVRKLIDAKTKKVAVNYAMKAFGDEVHATSSLFNPWAYGTKRFDPEINLYYFGSRYYDPQIRRWTSPDPQGWVDSPNLYTYCKNNPLKYADPNGEFVIVIPIVAGGAKAIITAAITGSKYASDKINKSREQKKSQVTNTQVGFLNIPVDKNTNPFEGGVTDPVIVGDVDGNNIPVGEGNSLTGSRDGTWVQERDENGNPTGTRIDGGHPAGPSHTDPRSNFPHAHVPGINNSDGTPWLPVKPGKMGE